MSKRGFEMLDLIVSVIVVGLLIQPDGRWMKRNIAIGIGMIYGIYRTNYAPNE